MRLERKNGHAFAVCAVSRRTSSQIFANGMPMTRNRANRKKRRQAKGCGLPLPPTLSDCAGTQFNVGSKLLHVAKQTSQHPPSPNLCVSKSTCRATGHYTCGCQLHTDIYKVKVVLGQSKIVKLQSGEQYPEIGWGCPIH